jgi:hypothetical protein
MKGEERKRVGWGEGDAGLGDDEVNVVWAVPLLGLERSVSGEGKRSRSVMCHL